MTSEEEKLIKEKIEDLKEYLEYGMNYSEYLDVVNAFEYIENKFKKQQKEIEELNILLKQQSKDIGYMLLNYTSNDKIKAKMEELDKEEKQMLKGTKGQDRYEIKQEYMHKRNVLQSLLEKEEIYEADK